MYTPLLFVRVSSLAFLRFQKIVQQMKPRSTASFPINTPFRCQLNGIFEVLVRTGGALNPHVLISRTCPGTLLKSTVWFSADPGSIASDAWAISLESYAGMDPTARLQRLLEGSTEESLPKDLPNLVVPFLSCLPRADRGRVMCELLALEAPNRLPWCAALLQLESQHLQVRLAAEPSCLFCAHCTLQKLPPVAISGNEIC